VTETFNEGDSVTWISQAGGFTKTKAGVIEAVVPAGSLPSRDAFAKLYRGSGVGQRRDQISYVVRVPTATGKGAGTVYWPRAGALSRAA
jgi:hypothetical protein